MTRRMGERRPQCRRLACCESRGVLLKRGERSGRLRAREIFGKYRIRRTIGVGGFATVYEATDTLEGRQEPGVHPDF